MKKLILTTLLIYLSTSPQSLAKVKAPNFGLFIKSLDFIKKDKKEIEKKLGKPVIIKIKKAEIYSYQLTESSYSFKINIQYRKNKVQDVYIILPSYFLHDPILKELQKKLGPQDNYIPHENSAFYRWNDQKNDLIYYYSASCTITCFPIYYSYHTKEITDPQLSIYQKELGQR